MMQLSLMNEFESWEQSIRNILAECCLAPDAADRLAWQHPRIATKIVNETPPLSAEAIQKKIDDLHSNLTRSSRKKRDIYLSDLFAVYKFTNHTPDYFLLGKRSPKEDFDALLDYAQKDGNVIKNLIESNPCMHAFIEAYYKYPGDFKLAQITLPRNTVFLNVFFAEIVDKFHKAFSCDNGIYRFNIRSAKFAPDCYELINTDMLGKENKKAVAIINSGWFKKDHPPTQDDKFELDEYRKKRRKVYTKKNDNTDVAKEEGDIPVRWTFEKKFEMSVNLCLLLCTLSTIKKVTQYQSAKNQSNKVAIERYLTANTDVHALILEFLVNSFLQVNQTFIDYNGESVIKKLKSNQTDGTHLKNRAWGNHHQSKIDSISAIIDKAKSKT